MISPDPFRPLPSKNVTSPLHCLAKRLDEVSRPFDVVEMFADRITSLFSFPVRLFTGQIFRSNTPRKLSLPLPLVAVASLLTQGETPSPAAKSIGNDPLAAKGTTRTSKL